jgi:hypothetical protein
MSHVHLALARRAAADDGSTDPGVSDAIVMVPVCPAESADPVSPPKRLDDRIRSEASAAAAAILNRSHAEWCRRFASLKQVLDGLQRACDTALAQQPPDSTQAVHELVGRLVEVVTIEADAAGQRARAAAQQTVADLQGRVAALDAKLELAVGNLQAAEIHSDEEHRARLKLEAALKEAEQLRDQLLEAREREIQLLSNELAAERVDRSHLRQQVATTLRTALASVQGKGGAASTEIVPLGDEREPTQQPASPRAGEAADGTLAPGSVATTPVREQDANAVARSTSTGIKPGSLAKDLLEEVEAAYRTDVEQNHAPADLVTRLTGHLASARHRFARAIGAARTATNAFDDQLFALLNSRYDSQFGRHLSIAIYDAYQAPGSAVQVA